MPTHVSPCHRCISVHRHTSPCHWCSHTCLLSLMHVCTHTHRRLPVTDVHTQSLVHVRAHAHKWQGRTKPCQKLRSSSESHRCERCYREQNMRGAGEGTATSLRLHPNPSPSVDGPQSISPRELNRTKDCGLPARTRRQQRRRRQQERAARLSLRPGSTPSGRRLQHRRASPRGHQHRKRRRRKMYSKTNLFPKRFL